MGDSDGLEIFELGVGIDPATGGEAQLRSVPLGRVHLDVLARFDLADAGDGEALAAVEAEARRAIAVAELEREHAHADEVRTVDALEAFGDYGANAEQQRALGRPVARAASAIFLAGDDHEGRA